MRCLAILLLESTGDIGGKPYLYGPSDLVTLNGFPRTLPFVCYGEVELEHDQWGIPTDVLWQLADMNGATTNLLEATGITPRGVDEDEMPLVWRLSHEMMISFYAAGRYTLRLSIDGALIADRPLLVRASTQDG